MREFFRGWRRKTGCITLVIACGLLGAGIRSTVIEDSWMMLGDGPATTYSLISKNLEILWVRQDGIVFGHDSEGFHSRKLTSRERDPEDYYDDLERDTNWIGFRFQCSGRDLSRDTQSVLVGRLSLVVRAIPYWSLVLPPTLLSAYLLLWKSRTRMKTMSRFVGEYPNLEAEYLKHRGTENTEKSVQEGE